MFLTIQEQRIEKELVEKRSKFIATLFYVKNEDEAQTLIKSVKKQYYDARHNCFAYRVVTENGIVERQSDDGEPSGTAGAPLLNILAKNNLCNVLVMVTRYFGGILLGTGGLVRAYSQVALDAVNSASFANEIMGIIAELEIYYTKLENMKYYCKKNDINITNIVYENNVKCWIELTQEDLNKMVDKDSKCDILNYRILCSAMIKKNVQ